jgi:uncharacterized membrane protein
MKQKIKSYGFWMSLTMAIIVVLQALGKAFSFTVNEEMIVSIVSSVVGVFVVLGFVNKKEAETKNKPETQTKPETKSK